MPICEQALDAVIAAPTFEMDGLRQFELFWEPFVLAAPKRHRLTGKSSVQAADLRSDEMVLLEDGHCLSEQVVEVCPSSRRGNFKTFHATSMETLRHLVAAGFGCTLMPQLAVPSSQGLQKLIEYRPFTGKPVGRKVILACRSRFSKMKDIETLAGFIRESVAPLFNTNLKIANRASRKKRRITKGQTFLRFNEKLFLVRSHEIGSTLGHPPLFLLRAPLVLRVFLLALSRWRYARLVRTESAAPIVSAADL